MIRRPPRPPLFPSPPLSRSAMASAAADAAHQQPTVSERARRQAEVVAALARHVPAHALLWNAEDTTPYECDGLTAYRQRPDRKSTRLNSSHLVISYAVFCLK